MPSESGEALACYLSRVDDEMRAVVQTDDANHVELYGMLRYHMGWVDAEFNPCQARTGKRVRPLLCLLACKAVGGDWTQAVPAGAAVELLHNFSLIHDDIEDRDEIRRGRPTLWVQWGEAQAINAGDALFALAHLALLRLSERGVPAETVIQVVHLFDSTELVLTMGQHLDISFESRDTVSVNDYLVMVAGKTSRLLACACEMGAAIAGASRDGRESMRAFGHHLGLAFQMRDDVLGVWGDPEVTGKPAGADIARRKKSLPILHGLERSAEVGTLLAQETLSEDDVRRAQGLLEETGSRRYSEQLAQGHHDQALAALAALDLQEEAARALHALAEDLLGRVS